MRWVLLNLYWHLRGAAFFLWSSYQEGNLTLGLQRALQCGRQVRALKEANSVASGVLLDAVRAADAKTYHEDGWMDQLDIH